MINIKQNERFNRFNLILAMWRESIRECILSNKKWFITLAKLNYIESNQVLININTCFFWYTHYTAHGGASNASAVCGAFCASDNRSASFAYWAIGAALSFKLDKIHIMLFVVVLLILILIAVCFLLLLIIVTLLHVGILMLLYMYTLYYSWW